jgi:hypothetical protein
MTLGLCIQNSSLRPHRKACANDARPMHRHTLSAMPMHSQTDECIGIRRYRRMPMHRHPQVSPYAGDTCAGDTCGCRCTRPSADAYVPIAYGIGNADGIHYAVCDGRVSRTLCRMPSSPNLQLATKVNQGNARALTILGILIFHF